MADEAMELRDRLQEVLGADFSVEHELGGGGMSRVFVAMDNSLGRRVVVKVLPRDLAAGVSVDRFKREIMLAAGLQHPHIVGVISAGEIDGLPYFVMPYVEGESLRQRLENAGPMLPRQAVSILRDVARALSYAHERGIVHRDIKPDNVLLTSGAATLADFGVAKALSSARAIITGDPGNLTSVGTSLGTPTYMAPEQVAGDAETDHRADIYALGVMAYEMLAGDPPFVDLSLQALMAAHLTVEPSPLDQQCNGVPARLTTLVMRCLEKDPALRPQTASEILEVLEDPMILSGATAAVTQASLGNNVRRQLPSRVKTVGAVLTALAIVAAGVTLLLGSNGGAISSAETEAQRSIAVLPLVNIGGDTSDTYFADGMSEELMNALNKVPGLRVASRTAAFSFKGQNASAAEMGEALNVSTLLEGTLRREGNRLRLTAQLTDVADGLALWSETYERELTDVFAMQDSLTQAIVGALREKFGGTISVGAVPEHGTDDLEAYDFYLRGRFFFQQRGADGLQRALKFFEQAVSRDRGYADAYTGIADVYGLMPLYSATPFDSVLPLALRAVTRAIALDSTLAGAFVSRGGLLNSAWRWSEAAVDLQRAIAIDARNATAHQWYGENLMLNGRVDEAVIEFARAAALDPHAPVMAALHGISLAVAGETDSAVERARHAVSLDPLTPVARFMLGAVYLYIGRSAEAIPEFEVARELAPGVATVAGLLGYAYAVTDQADRARSVLGSIDSTNLETGNAAAIARIHLGLGDHDSALRWLSRAAEAHDPFFGSEPLASPLFNPLRGDPRFAAVIRAVNLDLETLTATSREK
jgi:serine/threonine protein kinase/tetratricopeptide (TPR) repeat protein